MSLVQDSLDQKLTSLGWGGQSLGLKIEGEISTGTVHSFLAVKQGLIHDQLQKCHDGTVSRIKCFNFRVLQIVHVFL